jgi:RNA polymerase sigma-70 factor (ECF subfamily)
MAAQAWRLGDGDGQHRILYVLSLDIADGQIQGIRSVVNPDKLRHLGPVSDLLPTPPTPGPSAE